MFDGYRFVPGCRPQNGRAEVRKIVENFQHARDFEAADLGIGDRGK
jgi:hypothetical protein